MTSRYPYGQDRSRKGIKVFIGPIFIRVLWLIVGLCLCWVISASLISSYRFLTNWSFFCLETLTVQGNSLLTRQEILRTARLKLGQNTLGVSIARVEHRLIRHPWIKKVLVRRILPQKLLISVKEKVPFFWVKENGSIYYADRQGQCIFPVTAERFILLPFLKWDGNVRQQKILHTILARMAKDKSILDLKDLAWIRFVDREFLEFFVQDWGIKVVIHLQNIADNWGCLREMWHDLFKRDELKGVSRIMVYDQMGWVR
ncbi:MAG TPA: FtsQ-type POTRA domain-containing protein [Desulfohalobiaceae bacterium]|nr:FtsQ-type POTRA domain-containing protein [Desulfohalobiaceae bacterium]